jgi:hypothetical protein
MWTRSELIALINTRDMLIKLITNRERAAVTEPSPAPEPPPRKLRQSEQPGISMNELARSVSRQRPPRAPGQQRRRFNGLWWYY